MKNTNASKNNNINNINNINKEEQNMKLAELIEKAKTQYEAISQANAEVAKMQEKNDCSVYELAETIISLKANKLYQSEGKITFKEFCQQKLNFTSQYADMLVKAYNCNKKLRELEVSSVNIPYRRLRILGTYVTAGNDDQLKEIWLKATNNDSSKIPSAEDIQNAINGIAPKSQAYKDVKKQAKQMSDKIMKLLNDWDDKEKKQYLGELLKLLKDQTPKAAKNAETDEVKQTA